ncbi:tryptophan 2,3-dioxygenase [Aestuariispira insulae]|uniref:Tryptophan 2,3-dioxygenase n=1 Tax=Aestuariispira insulae TaxID=1461337 RepID=A0A3D9HJW0_9PROT|nr:tryptophan 2,3-dioxygenase [Aestuariispira insulae]RED49758.1 tryptophan 2,3-dioxygenase [Aestuariispira insulae]
MTETKSSRPGVFPEGAHGDFSGDMSYGDYLGLDSLLSSQHPQSSEHDEPLFIIIHQATELWMKLILHEMGAAIRLIREDNLQPAFKMLSRVSTIQNQMIQSWTVLATMTPADYLSFRDKLGHSSGFQSYQYREIEYRLGNKNPALLKPHAHREDIHARLKQALSDRSIYDEAIALLARRGFAIDDAILNRDFSERHQSNRSVHDAWATIYRNTTEHWELYELAEKLVDLEDSFQQWRFRHLKTVSRIIGMRRGTGGTSGVNYLEKALSYCFFPELWELRTDL